MDRETRSAVYSSLDNVAHPVAEQQTGWFTEATDYKYSQKKQRVSSMAHFLGIIT